MTTHGNPQKTFQTPKNSSKNIKGVPKRNFKIPHPYLNALVEHRSKPTPKLSTPLTVNNITNILSPMSTADNSSTSTNATDNGINALVHTSGNNNPIFNSTRPTVTTAPPPPNRPLELEGSMVIVNVESALDRYNAAVEAGLVA